MTTFRKLLNALRSIGRRWNERRHRTLTTDYAMQVNEMATQNLSSALRMRDRKREPTTISSCLRDSFPLPQQDDVSDRLREAVRRLEAEKRNRP